MSKGAINFSADNEYYTPKQIVDMFGRFEYDPATTPEKAKTWASRTTTRLKQTGSNLTGQSTSQSGAIHHSQSNTSSSKRLRNTMTKRGGDVCMIVPIEFLTTKRFHAICKGAKIFLPNGRIKYESGLGKPSRSPAFGSVVIKLDDHWSIEPLELA